MKWLHALFVGMGVLLLFNANAASTTYTFAAGPDTQFTNGDYLTGTLVVDFDTATVVSANLSLGNATGPTVFTEAQVGYFDQFSNTVCGKPMTFYEVNFFGGSAQLWLDIVPQSTLLIPGTSGVHSSWSPTLLGNYALQNQCSTFVAALTPAVPSLSQPGALVLSLLLVMAAIFMLRWRPK